MSRQRDTNGMFVGSLDRAVRDQGLRVHRNDRNRCRLTNARMRRYRRITAVEGEVGQGDLRQNQNGCE